MDGAPAPSTKQLRYLRVLAERTETTFTPPDTREQASREIDRLRHQRFETHEKAYERDETDDQAHDTPAYATAAHPEEIAGRGSTAHWRNTPPATELPAALRRTARDADIDLER
jgi:hypothetical protein